MLGASPGRREQLGASLLGLLQPWVVGSVLTANVTILRSFNLLLNYTVPFMSDHDGFKSSQLDSYSKLGVVAVWFQTAPLEAFVISQKWYRKLAVRGAFSSGRFCVSLCWCLHLQGQSWCPDGLVIPAYQGTEVFNPTQQDA